MLLYKFHRLLLCWFSLGLIMATSFIPEGKVRANEAKALPNYLRPSLGSCHDYCKYGRKRDSSETGPMKKFIKKSHTTPDKIIKSVKTSNVNEKRKVAEAPIWLQETKSRRRSQTSTGHRVGVGQSNKVGDMFGKHIIPASKLKPIETKVSFWKTFLERCNGQKVITIRAIKPNPQKRVPMNQTVSQKAPNMNSRKHNTTKKASQPKKHKHNREESISFLGEWFDNIPEKTIYAIEPESENTRETKHATNSTRSTLSTSDIVDLQEPMICSKEIENTSKEKPESKIEEVIDHQNRTNDDAKKKQLRRTVSDGIPKRTEDRAMETVNLRRQVVERKSSDPALLNNVIEETASRLVKKRKGKVKALVGAFEAVISLQDTK